MDQCVPGTVQLRDVNGVNRPIFFSRALAAFVCQVQARPLFAHVAKHIRGSLRVLKECGFTLVDAVHDTTDASGQQIEEYGLRSAPRSSSYDTVILVS